MSNNKKQLNRAIFARLEALLPTDNLIVSSLVIGDESIRYISTEKGSVAQEILTEGVIENSIEVFNKTHLYSVSLKEKSLLIITGVSDSNSFLKGVNTLSDPDNSEQDMRNNPGLISLMFSQDNFPILKDVDIGYRLLNDIFSKEGSEDGRFEASELIPFFSSFSVWELDSTYSIKNSDTLLAIYSGYLITSEEKFNLKFQLETLQSVKLLIEELPIDLIGGNLFRAVVSMEWKHSFLELYQCVEYLFPIPYLLKLSDNLADLSSFNLLFKHIENDLNWKPREDQALERLFKEIEDKSSVSKMLDCLKEVFKIIGSIDSDKEINVISKNIYKTRNSIAHFRSALSIEISSDSDWNNIIDKLCGITYDLYIKYSAQISSIK